MADTLFLEVEDFGDITVRRPDFGYITEINMRLHFSNVINIPHEIIPVWDDGASYDTRKCKIKSWLLNTSEQEDFIYFMNEATMARGNNEPLNNVRLKLGSTPTGFFPFGADYGDKEDFHIMIPTTDYKEGKLLYDPLRFWENDVTFCLYPPDAQNPLPSYTPPAQENEGDLQLGDVYNLLCPQEPAEPQKNRRLNSSIAGGGMLDFIDLGSPVDELITNLKLEMKQGNCAALIKFLTGASGRAFDFPADFPDIYPFGIANNYGSIFVQLMSGKIEILHENFQRFISTLKLRHCGAPV